MLVWQSYSLSFSTRFGANMLYNINNLGVCIRVRVYNTLSMQLDISHGMIKSEFGV